MPSTQEDHQDDTPDIDGVDDERDDIERDGIQKCESGVGMALRGAVWGVQWMAYCAKFILVQSYGAMDKTVATGGCRHDPSPGEIGHQPLFACMQFAACTSCWMCHLCMFAVCIINCEYVKCIWVWYAPVK